MTSKRKEHRKLAAIMFTDMVGYSMLSQNNETLALDLVDEHRRVLRPLFAKHHGHEIEAVGDVFFVEFAAALEAVHCAVEIQETLHKRNLSLPEHQGIHLRIGLHLGDVVHHEKHVHGDGVNIAARIEPLAQAGGICVSEDVARQIQNKISLPIQKLGKGELKNIKVPVEIFRIVLPWEKRHLPLVERSRYMLRQQRTLKYGVAFVLLSFLVYGAIELYFSHLVQEPIKSIAVLPFRNSSEVPEYLADGLTQGLINSLSQLPYLRVISGNSVFRYKGQSTDLAQVGRDLGVDALLSGEIVQIGDGLSTGAELTDTRTGIQIWNGQFKGKQSDILDVTEEVTTQLTPELDIPLSIAVQQRLSRYYTTDKTVAQPR